MSHPPRRVGGLCCLSGQSLSCGLRKGVCAKHAAASFAGRCGDGLEEGAFGTQVAQAYAGDLGLPPDVGWGGLDPLHASCSAAEQSDKEHAQHIEQYLRVARAQRSRYGFGV